MYLTVWVGRDVVWSPHPRERSPPPLVGGGFKTPPQTFVDSWRSTAEVLGAFLPLDPPPPRWWWRFSKALPSIPHEPKGELCRLRRHPLVRPLPCSSFPHPFPKYLRHPEPPMDSPPESLASQEPRPPCRMQRRGGKGFSTRATAEKHGNMVSETQLCLFI